MHLGRPDTVTARRGLKRSPDLAGQAPRVFSRVGQESIPDAVEQLQIYFSAEVHPREKLLLIRASLAARHTNTPALAKGGYEQTRRRYISLFTFCVWHSRSRSRRPTKRDASLHQERNTGGEGPSQAPLLLTVDGLMDCMYSTLASTVALSSLLR